MASLKGRRFFFGTGADLRPGLARFEQAQTVEYVLDDMRDDTAFTVLTALSEGAALGHSTTGAVISSAMYLVFPRGKHPAPRAIRQRRGGTKYLIDPTSECLILRCGGLHDGSGALIAGELQQPLAPSRGAVTRFRLLARELLRGFTRVRDYWLGPEALDGFRGGQRLVTISVKSPREYDLADT